jgi:hypothetical protein
MLNYRVGYFLSLLLLTACAQQRSTPVYEAATLPVLRVYTSAATQPWLDEVYLCAAEQPVLIRVSATASAADIRVSLGLPAQATAPAYLIGTETVWLITHPQSPLQTLTVDQARALFANGQANLQLWAFAPGEDVQQSFERDFMQGLPLNSLARLATSPTEMLAAVSSDPQALGLLPGRWLNNGVYQALAIVENLPVLAQTDSQPQGPIGALLACLQK